MSKDNMLLGFARGKVGDLVFYRRYGEQVTRARNAAPANPRTIRQSVQRSILKTVSSAYSLFSPIADHSFEGIDGKTPNQSEFTRLNISLLRSRILASGLNLDNPTEVLDSEMTNYSSKDTTYPVLNNYIISAGRLQAINYNWDSSLPGMVYSGSALPTEPTYQQFIDAFGLLRGDQLTFLWVYGNDGVASDAGLLQGFEYSRLILEPANGDMSTQLWTEEGAGIPTPIGSPNPRNEGRISFDSSAAGRVAFVPAPGALGDVDEPKTGVACAVILSRKIGDQWKRSGASLVKREGLDKDTAIWYLGDAVSSFMDPPSSSNLYLNQAVDG